MKRNDMPADARAETVSVCICTFRRPRLLAKLLDALEKQVTNDLFTYSIVVVDNDPQQSALSVVESYAKRSLTRVSYCHEPEPNIAQARNRAIREADGACVAFLDDDEFPIAEWLLRLYTTLHNYKADGVLGPVKPHFEVEPPQWILKGRICERPSYPTGFVLKRYRDTRTGNVMLTKRIFDNMPEPFNPDFGKTGGEDVDFFRRMMEKGFIFVSCDDAEVYEGVPPERQTRGYYLKRALMRGRVAFLHPPLKIKIFGVAKSTIAIIVYSIMLPFCFMAGAHIFMRYLIKYCDHLGKVLTAIGIEAVRTESSYNTAPKS